ncbi:MAG: GNAT family N-acetyltransferase [Humidesulfovibrio sp.]|uniref:GNAT family N-acetyltransferase n=1 Tax=Humidesulfovibrio sp. TaxID=2910988 RepID=UPI0027F83DE7|nr:GNAT family N-acetyltransferase [Humidesulfovibrio sp.]MDQ7835202.1 GNAT family N-acetyltransferase [Humidesulfovibrio sp.]
MIARALAISAYADADRQGMLDLICTIQRNEFALPITAADQPDLLDAPGFYRRGCGDFWVARAGGEVVGSIALLDIGNGQGALRKMFVRRDWRRGYSSAPELGGAGVAFSLLHTLLKHAAASGLRDIFLGTTTRFQAAHRFYEKNGFERIDKIALPESFPVMAVDSVFYWKRL